LLSTGSRETGKIAIKRRRSIGKRKGVTNGGIGLVNLATPRPEGKNLKIYWVFRKEGRTKSFVKANRLDAWKNTNGFVSTEEV